LSYALIAQNRRKRTIKEENSTKQATRTVKAYINTNRHFCILLTNSNNIVANFFNFVQKSLKLLYKKIKITTTIIIIIIAKFEDD